MRLCCGLMEGQMWDAALQPAAEGALEGNRIVVLSNDEMLSPADADFGEFSIVEATADERETLRKAGYSMPDWDPRQGLGCAGCHEGGTRDDQQPEGMSAQEE